MDKKALLENSMALLDVFADLHEHFADTLGNEDFVKFFNTKYLETGRWDGTVRSYRVYLIFKGAEMPSPLPTTIVCTAALNDSDVTNNVLFAPMMTKNAPQLSIEELEEIAEYIKQEKVYNMALIKYGANFHSIYNTTVEVSELFLDKIRFLQREVERDG